MKADFRLTVPFALPDIGSAEIESVVDCLRSGWITTGAKSAEFEQSFASFVGGGIQAIAVSSCTAGLEIALAALGIGLGDEVITTDYTFSATAMSVVHVGAKPVVVDIDPHTLNIDPERIEAAITPKTKAILPVHYAGLACDMGAIGEIAKRHGLRVVEDAAHALPTTWNGKMVGQATSDAAVFSFYATKTITTGEGGMITVSDPDLAKKMRILRLHGIDRDAFDRYSSSRGSWEYEIVAPGYKANLTDIMASIGIVQLRRAWGFQKRRFELAERYNRSLWNLPVLLPPAPRVGDTHSHHLYPIRINAACSISRDDFIRHMREKGINCSVHFIPLHLHSYWRKTLGLDEKQFPEAQKAYGSIVSLPLFSSMSDEMQEYVIENVIELLG